VPADPAVIARLCERIGDVLRDAAGHDDARQALVVVLARWVAIGALADETYADQQVALGVHFARVTVELHVSAQAAFDRMRNGWNERN